MKNFTVMQKIYTFNLVRKEKLSLLTNLSLTPDEESLEALDIYGEFCSNIESVLGEEVE